MTWLLQPRSHDDWANTHGKNRGFLFQDNPWIFLFLNRFGMGLRHLIIEALETIWTNHQEEVAL